jgi:hypothetical protein
VQGGRNKDVGTQTLNHLESDLRNKKSRNERKEGTEERTTRRLDRWTEERIEKDRTNERTNEWKEEIEGCQGRMHAYTYIHMHGCMAGIGLGVGRDFGISPQPHIQVFV